MDKVTADQIITHMDKIAQKLGVGTDQIWPWFIKQVYINSFLAWIYLVIILSIIISITIFLIKHWNPIDIDRNGGYYNIVKKDHEPIWMFILVISSITFVFIFVNFLIEGFNFLNPEYEAFTKLIKMFKS